MNFFSVAGLTGRWAVILATGVAMLLPMPGRCATCLASAGDCPRCVAAQAAEAPSQGATKSCCQHRAAKNDSPVSTVTASSVHHGTHWCGCVVRSAPRTVPTVEKQLMSADLIAALAVPVGVVTDLTDYSAAAGVSTPNDSPPSIPHRILHCSWII